MHGPHVATKIQSNENPLFGLIALQEYPEISQKAVQCFYSILPFSTTYLWESAFLFLSQIKTKSRSQLKSVEDKVRVCLTSIPLRIKMICA